ncbi:hypothetical protein MSG28_006333 [Choristoneura fumiferana]|uniref:Uncharacterized protein n=1 Tax=Choristoneura fumiferana TaxID=7141 RepID=A0ACC0JEF2_CHOFU|nr:hypothetical protein MSG28_006333 [Choristoneura fumiferana]
MMTSEDKLYPNCDSSIWLRSCEKEVTEPLEGDVTGEIPTWVRGTLLRNGPGSLKVGSMRFGHLFDSSALLHRFAIHDGRATYQCRFLQSNTYKRNQAERRIVFSEFGTSAVPDPCHTIFDRVAAIFNPGESLSDNAMISVYPFGDEMYAFTEGPVIHRIDPVTLDTLERKNLSKSLALVNHTSHPHVMPNGDMFERAHVVGTMKPRWPLHPAYMHTFGVTENYFVIVEQPLSVSLMGVTHIVLISRKTGKEVTRYRTDTLFYLHIINAFEQDGRLVVDLCAYNDAKVIDAMYIQAIEAKSKRGATATVTPVSLSSYQDQALSLKELARVSFRTPSAAPKCLHGWFLPGLVCLWNNSVLTMAALAIERYIAIWHPLMLKPTSAWRRVSKIIVLVWLLAIAATLLEMQTVDLVKVHQYTMCFIIPTPWARFLNGVLAIVTFVIPLITMILAHSTIVYKVINTQMDNTRDTIFNHEDPRGKITKLVIVDSVVLPHHYQQLVHCHNEPDTLQSYVNEVQKNNKESLERKD